MVIKKISVHLQTIVYRRCRVTCPATNRNVTVCTDADLYDFRNVTHSRLLL